MRNRRPRLPQPLRHGLQPDGDLFTFDSDNERCVSLPWYEPTRFYHVIDGRHYGWLNPQHAITWRRPPYFCDVVAPIATLGRGSPTGVVCYAHNQFPSEYHGGFFLGDWTFGKIHFATLQRKGASYTATTKVFLESLGDNGFAPTACAIDPTTGDLYVSIGGRGTRGAVYRVRHPERYAAIKDKLGPYTMAKRSLEWKEGMKKEIEDKITQSNAVGVLTAEAHERLWALQMLRRHNSQWDDKAFSTFFPRAMATLAKDSDLHVRQALADLVERTMQRANPKDALPDNLQAFANRYVAAYRFNPWVRRPTTDEDHLFCLRLMQLSLGDVGARNAIGTIWEGYTRRNEKFAVKELDELKADIGELKTYAADFPMRRANVDREIARTLAMVGWDDPNVRWLVLRRTGAETDPVDDIHYLACYAQLGGKRTDKETPLVAATLLDLDRKIAARKLNRDSNWAPRVSELYVGLVEKNAALHQAMLEHPAFGRSDHALFANTPGFPKERAARIFLERWAKDGNFALTGNIVQLFDAVPAADVLPTVRKRWGETGQEAALLPLLAKAPMASDRGKFIEGLKSPQAATVEACVKGLNVIGAKSDASESFALIRALQQQANQSTDKKTPAANAGRLAKLVADRLEKTTGQAFATDSKRWIAWLQETHPEFGKRLANPDGVDVGKWDQRLAKLDWDNGNAAAGKVVFSKASCLTCHSGSQALGPDLVGVTGRFSRADVLTAIIQPSKDVPTRYQTTVLETKDGKTYQGIVIYDAVDSLILQTGAATTVRLDGGQVVSRFVSAQSLMPAGLLDPLSDREIVDLYAYLRELGKK
jgi:putative heme-binding domain-containing protein